MSSSATRLNGVRVTSLVSCPVLSGDGGLWWDGNTTGPKWRKADGTDVTLGSGGGSTGNWVFSGNNATFPSSGQIAAIAQGLTNTTGLTINPNVADGASSIGLLVSLGTVLNNGTMFRVSDGSHDIGFALQASSYPKLTTTGTNMGFFNTNLDGFKVGTGLLSQFIGGADLVDLSSTSIAYSVARVLHTVAQTSAIAASDNVITVDTSAGRSFTLPAATNVGRELIFADSTNTAATHNITITPNGTDTINGINAAITISTNSGVKTLRNIVSGKWIAY